MRQKRHKEKETIMVKEEILVIEDEFPWQRELKSILEGNDYEVTLATNYSEAVEALKSKTAKVAVVDMSLIPGDAHDRQGLEVAKEAVIPVVCISGYLTEDEAEKLNEDCITPWFFTKQAVANKKKKFLESVAAALTQSKDEIRTKWNIIEHRFRQGD